jgi:heat shock protein HtpX
MNALKTALLLGLMSAILVAGGGALAGRRGVWLGLAFAVVMNFASYFFSEKMALLSSGAVPVTPQENPHLYARLYPMAQRLCQRMGIPVPKLWVIPEESPNAFATGRNPQHSSVAFTEGLLRYMNDAEVEGVMAHELAHIKHRDILISSIAATIGGAITAVAQFGFLFGGRSDDDDAPNPLVAILTVVLGSIASMLIQMAISRTREYAADAGAAEAAGTPNGLISALAKLESWSQRIPLDANPAMSHMYIIKPFTGGGLGRWFSTHPATADRIARLRAAA